MSETDWEQAAEEWDDLVKEQESAFSDAQWEMIKVNFYFLFFVIGWLFLTIKTGDVLHIIFAVGTIVTTWKMAIFV